MFELALGPVALAFCGSSGPGDQKIMDEILDHSHQEFAEAFLHKKDLSWAVDIYRQWPGRPLSEIEPEDRHFIAAE